MFLTQADMIQFQLSCAVCTEQDCYKLADTSIVRLSRDIKLHIKIMLNIEPKPVVFDFKICLNLNLKFSSKRTINLLVAVPEPCRNAAAFSDVKP
jgi:hypothetical protein